MPEKGVKRFTVSVSPDLLEGFDAAVIELGYDRSKAVGLAMRNFLAEYTWDEKEENLGAGALSLIYDHEKRQADKELTEIQHAHMNAIVSTTHIHLDHRNCLLIIAVRGSMVEIRSLFKDLVRAKGVKQVRLTTLTL
jgi:CopG family nickel-responsive transcriptional regulator